MQFSNEEKNTDETVSNEFKNIPNSHCYQNEQDNAEKNFKISEDILNKTIDAFYKIEKMNDEKIKQMIESHIGKPVIDDKYEKIEYEIQSSSNITSSIQTCVFKKNEV